MSVQEIFVQNWVWKKKHSKKYFKNFDTLIFENTEFNIPNNTDDLLKIRYG